MWSDCLVVCDCGFSLSALWCPLSGPTILLGFLLPWTWGISSRLLQQSAAGDPHLEASPHPRSGRPRGATPRPRCLRKCPPDLVPANNSCAWPCGPAVVPWTGSHGWALLGSHMPVSAGGKAGWSSPAPGTPLVAGRHRLGHTGSVCAQAGQPGLLHTMGSGFQMQQGDEPWSGRFPRPCCVCSAMAPAAKVNRLGEAQSQGGRDLPRASIRAGWVSEPTLQQSPAVFS